MRRILFSVAFLLVCSKGLAPGQSKLNQPSAETSQYVEPIHGDLIPIQGIPPLSGPWSLTGVDEKWLSIQSTVLLDIIKILYKGIDDANVKKLEDTQAKWPAKEQIERRISFIKEFLENSNPTSQPSPSPSEGEHKP